MLNEIYNINNNDKDRIIYSLSTLVNKKVIARLTFTTMLETVNKNIEKVTEIILQYINHKLSTAKPDKISVLTKNCELIYISLIKSLDGTFHSNVFIFIFIYLIYLCLSIYSLLQETL